MANDIGTPTGGSPFRRLAAFEMSADRALKKLRERRQAELDVQQIAAEKSMFGNFLAGGKTAAGGFQPFQESNLPNVAGLATSKRYAPVIDALMGVEGIRQKDRLAKDQEFQDLLGRYRAETDRMKAETERNKPAVDRKTTTDLAIAAANGDEKAAKALALLRPPKAATSKVDPILKDIENRKTKLTEEAKKIGKEMAAFDYSIASNTDFGRDDDGNIKDAQVVNAYNAQKAVYQSRLKSVGDEITRLDKALKGDWSKRKESTPAPAATSGKIKVRLTKDIGGQKGGTLGLIDESEFDGSYMERVK